MKSLIHAVPTRPFSRIVSVIGIISFTLSLGACNTFRGMGKDVERGGERVQDAATNVQKKL